MSGAHRGSDSRAQSGVMESEERAVILATLLILQERKLREMKGLAQGHIASGECQNLNLGLGSFMCDMGDGVLSALEHLMGSSLLPGTR